MITCPNCQASNNPQSKFCNRCGTNLQGVNVPIGSTCPKCKLPLSPTSRFCPNCGAISTPLERESGSPKPQQEIKLVIRFPGGNIEKHTLITGQQIGLGRNPGNQIRINFPGVSGQHLQLKLEGETLSVTDLNSTNGTEVNGQKIKPMTPLKFQSGDIMRIRDGLGNSIAMHLDTGGPVSLRIRSMGMHNLSQVTNVLLIGRDPSSDLPLNHPTVSSKHARLERRGSNLFIQDLGSTNGTFVNGRRISQTYLGAGDVIQIGPFKLVWDEQKQRLAQALGLGHRLDALNLGLEVSGGKMILDKINMSVMPGEFISLVGGSGAGKSTLLKALNGFNKANHGQMLLDGEEFYTHLDLYRSQMGYVPQDDIIHMDLPVDVALRYAAKLRLPGHSDSEIEKRVHGALEQVDMLEHRYKKVKVLSGGQRKRVSIASELLAKPTLFFLDEPTSGLDPGLEKQMMQDLNKLSDTGTTVVLVTHATANIEECDQVAFLDKGLLAYYGPPREALQFFDVRDFADIYRRLSAVINPDKGTHPPKKIQPYYDQVVTKQGAKIVPAGGLWTSLYRQSPQYKQYVQDRQQQLGKGQVNKQASQSSMGRKSKGSFIKQTWILSRRQFDLTRNNWMMLIILLAMMPAISLLFVAVSDKYDFTGWPISAHQIEGVLKANILCSEDEYQEILDNLEEMPISGSPRCVQDALITETVRNMEGGEDKIERIKPNIDHKFEDEQSAEYIPTAAGDTLVSMVSLAITQGGTFAAAYEIVKEKAIFKRERAVNLRVSSYLFSKVVVLSLFGLVQVAGVILVLSLKINLKLDSVFGFPNGPWEMYITLALGILASIMFGLFISAAVSTQDIVIYLILAQLFVQIILSGSMFPMENNPMMRVTIANWTMDAMGSITNMDQLNREGIGCAVKEMEIEPNGRPWKVIGCDAIGEREFGIGYEHTAEHVFLTWVGLAVHFLIWAGLTYLILYRRKGD